MPVAIAPTGLTGMQHADGEILAAQAAEDFGIPFTLSTMSICSIEDIAEHTGRHPFWFQLYVMRDQDFMARLIDRAKAANCSALVLTLDLQILGQRHKDIKNGLSAPPKPTLANLINLATKPRWCLGMLGTKRRSFGNIVGPCQGGRRPVARWSSWTAEQFDPRLTWGDVEWIKKRWGGKLILKGIMDAEDARAGRRQRRRCASWSATTAAASWTARRRPSRRCPRLPRPWAQSIEVWMDGGIRSGPGRAQGPGAGRARHHDRAQLSLRPGRVWRGRRDPRAADHPEGAGHHHGVLRPHQYQHRGQQNFGARNVSGGPEKRLKRLTKVLKKRLDSFESQPFF